jgi:hypothetical protein
MREMNLRSAVGIVACGWLLLAGCKDQQQCTDALATARKAMQDEFLDMSLARQWRDYSGKVCGAGPDVETLDKDIIAREAAIAKAAEDKAKAEAEAGGKAMEAAKKAWQGFDKLEDKEKTPEALKKASKKANKVIVGLTPDYGKQVIDYNKKELSKRKKALAKAEAGK